MVSRKFRTKYYQLLVVSIPSWPIVEKYPKVKFARISAAHSEPRKELSLIYSHLIDIICLYHYPQFKRLVSANALTLYEIYYANQPRLRSVPNSLRWQLWMNRWGIATLDLYADFVEEFAQVGVRWLQYDHLIGDAKAIVLFCSQVLKWVVNGWRDVCRWMLRGDICWWWLMAIRLGRAGCSSKQRMVAFS